MEQEEIWRDIEGYEGLYEVSNLGRVRSSDSYNSLGRLHLKGRIRKPVVVRGYLRVELCKEGKGKWFYVHRLVAHVFIPNPEGLPEINHRDENKTNNLVDNLEYCDRKYNCNYGTRNERMTKNRVQSGIDNGTYDPELCGIRDKNERERLRYLKKREQINERRREQRLKKKKSNRPSEESLW